MFDIIITGLAHVSFICLGLSSFLLIACKLRDKYLEPPIIQLFWVFVIYGGLMLMILHSLTWRYSGMVFIGLFAVAFIAPVIGFLVSYSLRRIKGQSKSHFLLFVLGLLYSPIVVILLAAMFGLIMKLEGDI